MVEEGVDSICVVGMDILPCDDRPRTVYKSSGYLCGHSGMELSDGELVVGVEFGSLVPTPRSNPKMIDLTR